MYQQSFLGNDIRAHISRRPSPIRSKKILYIFLKYKANGAVFSKHEIENLYQKGLLVWVQYFRFDEKTTPISLAVQNESCQTNLNSGDQKYYKSQGLVLSTLRLQFVLVRHCGVFSLIYQTEEKETDTIYVFNLKKTNDFECVQQLSVKIC